MHITNNLNEDGLPFGGSASAVGLHVDFQKGPLGENGHNGCFVEDLLIAAIERLEFYQASKFNCAANAKAIHHLRIGLKELEMRTAERKDRGVEGTHEV